jgi:hypothetical protein
VCGWGSHASPGGRACWDGWADWPCWLRLVWKTFYPFLSYKHFLIFCLIFYGKKEEKGKGFAKDSNLLKFEIFCSKFKRFFSKHMHTLLFCFI